MRKKTGAKSEANKRPAGVLLESSPRELSQSELEACELEAHEAVPEDATDSEAEAIYAEAFRKSVERRRRGDDDLLTYGLSLDDDDLD